MVNVGNDILFQEPTVSTRRLRRSVVVATRDDSISVRFVSEPFPFEVGQDVLMYFNGKREFMQQVGRIREIERSEAPAAPVADPAAAIDATGAAASAEAADVEEKKEGPVIEIEPIGDPISAENREYYRVSTISAGIQARLGTEANIHVQDLSATGFAVLAGEKYSLGQVIDVDVRHGDEACHGLVSVQSFRELESGRVRYGLRAIEQDLHARDFLATLQRISLAVQRDQLHRTGGAR